MVVFMRERFYQKTWFKNTVLILIPTAVSVIGVFTSITSDIVIKIILTSITVILMITLVAFVIYYGNQEDKVYNELQEKDETIVNLTNILAHMENDYKTVTYEISSLSELAEKWATVINSFANNVKLNGCISDKAWDKVKQIDAICLYCRDMIKQYCNLNDNSGISVCFVEYSVDENNVEWVHMIAHSNPISLRPSACKERVKLSDCKYHYAELIRDKLSDIEIAISNDEILRIFKKVSFSTDLSKYSQYIAIPLYCKSGKLLGIFQIVTKHNYIIESDKVKLEQFITKNIIPLCNLVVLADKINKGLYITPSIINKEHSC